ncbi:MAG: hypothetical protein H0V49_00435 [Nocardioidaceae bacterium]|nr:hypothetical protein [Nocardioidaceae bacterium]
MTDEIERRLRAADPLRAIPQERSADSWSPAELEAIMNAADPRQQQSTRVRWITAAGSAAAVTLIAVGSYALVAKEKTEPEPSAQPPLELTLPGSGSSMASCMPFSSEVLAGMSPAFSGTAVEVDDDSVLLDVDHWYAGGGAQQVELQTLEGATVSLEGVPEFVSGERYLVTAANGVVNACGFTSMWSDENAAVFDEAFTS